MFPLCWFFRGGRNVAVAGCHGKINIAETLESEIGLYKMLDCLSVVIVIKHIGRSCVCASLRTVELTYMRSFAFLRKHLFIILRRSFFNFFTALRQPTTAVFKSYPMVEKINTVWRLSEWPWSGDLCSLTCSVTTKHNSNGFKLDRARHYITVSGYVLCFGNKAHIVPDKLRIVPHLFCLMVVTPGPDWLIWSTRWIPGGPMESN